MDLQFVMLGTGNVDRCEAFYREKLDLEPAGRFGDFAFFKAGGVQIALSGELGRSESGAACELVFGVSSVRHEYELLKARGVDFLNEPHPVNQENWVVNLRDPDGHLLSLYGKQ